MSSPSVESAQGVGGPQPRGAPAAERAGQQAARQGEPHGEQQRVAIARALVREPKVILADEPTGNLDERTRDDIIGLLEELWRERGQTLIVVSHDTWVAGRASRRIWLDAGKLQAPPVDDRPGAEATAAPVPEPALQA